MIRGPILELAQESSEAYGMQECTFTCLKDIFMALIESQSRTGVLSPQRFLEIFKRDNEGFRNSMHQDAHEFYGIVLNDVIANVEANAKRMQELTESTSGNGHAVSNETAPSHINTTFGTGTPGTGWVHDIFEGVLTSETRCLACETASQRDETFLDLSIDLEQHSSVTACLQSFSAEEMLCERNKFHCDRCGGLQEAEKRMKIKKLPKVLALHLKRFKYTEDFTRLQKLFHRVVYPYHLRMFNTTDDVEDPDRMYELYAVVVHIGGQAVHGHYVVVIKTKDRGWLLFDDEMVEPVDKTFVLNFFGDKPGMACAYVLFYQETTFEKVREEMDAEGLEQVKLASQAAELAANAEQVNGATSVPILKVNTQTLPPASENEILATVERPRSTPNDITSPAQPPPPLSESEAHPLIAAPPPAPAVMTKADEAATVPPKTKEEKAREKRELRAQEKAQEKARKAAEKERARLAAQERQEQNKLLREALRSEQDQLQKAIRESKQTAADEEKRHKTETSDAAGPERGSDNHKNSSSGFLSLADRSRKSMMARKSFAFLKVDKERDKDKAKADKGDRTDRSEGGSDNRSDLADSSTTTTTGAGESASHNLHAQNGTGARTASPLPARLGPPPRSDTAPAAVDRLLPTHKDKPPLMERFSFGLGRKKSSKFLSTS
jgi:ubiquitin carboxyl-terminal hydrolase 9/13